MGNGVRVAPHGGAMPRRTAGSPMIALNAPVRNPGARARGPYGNKMC